MTKEIDVKKIARLARLSVSEEESRALAKDLEAILGYVENLNSVSVDEIEPLSHVHGVSNVFRPDRSRDYWNRDQILKNLPDASGRFIRVPIIIGENEE